MSTEQIKAVHSKDLVQYLESLNVLTGVESGIFACKYCETAITLDNISCIFPEEGEVKFVCDSPSCVYSLLEARKGNV